jgi:hypothetical protein
VGKRKKKKRDEFPEDQYVDFSSLEPEARTSALEDLYAEDSGFDGVDLESEEEDDLPRFSEINKRFKSKDFNIYANGETPTVTKNTFELWPQTGKGKFDPFTIVQNFGDCVDAAFVEMMAGFLGFRASIPSYNEVLHYIAAFYHYAQRGYCGHGWSMYECAKYARRFGWCPAKRIELNNHVLDFDDENDSEYKVARDWCRSGPPRRLEEWTAENYPFEEGAISSFDGDTSDLKELLLAGGALHHGSNYTADSSRRPTNLKRIGAHAQTLFKGEWSERTLDFFNERSNYNFDEDDFPCANHQTWGNWSGEVSNRFWPSWWGPKPQGAWIISSKQYFKYFNSRAQAYLPLFKGIPSESPGPIPPEPVPPEEETVKIRLIVDVPKNAKAGQFDHVIELK